MSVPHMPPPEARVYSNTEALRKVYEAMDADTMKTMYKNNEAVHTAYLQAAERTNEMLRVMEMVARQRGIEL